MDENKQKLDVWIVKIQNQERMVRQRALKELLEFCQNEKNLNKENSIELFDFTYLCLIKCYSDKYEMCRSLACSIITEILKHLQQNDYYLSLLVPVIAKRLAPLDIVEESEEMRLQLLKQLNFIIDKYKDLKITGAVRDKTGDGQDRLLKPYNDIIDILKVRLMDNYPAILKECCEVIKLTAIASSSFHYRAESLAEPLITLLKHRHSGIRIAAVEALGVVGLNILTNCDKLRRIIKEISPLLMDPVPFVRRECGRVGCLFLMKLCDRYSLFEPILPLVMCCLTDEIEEVRTEIEKSWLEAGNLYYNENEAELQKLNLIEQVPADYPKIIPKRPTIGCRALVRRSLRVLNIILHEMEDWKEEVRLHSTKLLYQVVIHSEDQLASKYYDINAVLCKTCQDQEAPIAKLAMEVAGLIGYFVDQKTWSKYAFEELRTRQNKLGPIKCLNALYRESVDKEKYQNVSELIDIFMDNSICHNTSVPFQTEFLENLKILHPGVLLNENVVENYYIVTLKMTAVGYDNEVIRNEGINILKLIAEPESVSKIHAKYLKSALKTLDLLDKANNDSFEQIMVLYGIICICGFEKSFLEDLKSSIKLTLEHADGEGKIKILSAMAMAALNWDKTIDVEDPNENFLIMMSYINECIAPHLIWHAGRTAESVRTMATAVLSSLVQGTTKENFTKIVDALLVPLISLVDDNNIATRSYALKILMHVGPLKYDNLKNFGSGLLSRLDDPGHEVRVKAAKCLGKLKLIESDQDDFNDMWEHLLKQIFSTMMIHLESPEIDLRNNLIDSIVELCHNYTNAYIAALKEAILSEELKQKLPAASS
ncbi:unnamed protein product [Chironomus riparius]|uniref:Uncharacterized protein n=1 Tax=Chironomus riparius TaxID=315576 RepID=A0A9N9WTL7_9DIPT|nr:unnamed protein product [Chironomus riparius]